MSTILKEININHKNHKELVTELIKLQKDNRPVDTNPSTPDGSVTFNQFVLNLMNNNTNRQVEQKIIDNYMTPSEQQEFLSQSDGFDPTEVFTESVSGDNNTGGNA